MQVEKLQKTLVFILIFVIFHIYYDLFSSFLLSLMQVEKLQKTSLFIIEICHFTNLYLQYFCTESYASREASKDFSIYIKYL